MIFTKIQVYQQAFYILTFSVNFSWTIIISSTVNKNTCCKCFFIIKKDPKRTKSKRNPNEKVSVAHFFYYPNLLPVFFVLNWNDPRLSYSSFFSVFLSLSGVAAATLARWNYCVAVNLYHLPRRLPQTAISAKPRGFYDCHSYLRSPKKRLQI